MTEVEAKYGNKNIRIETRNVCLSKFLTHHNRKFTCRKIENDTSSIIDLYASLNETNFEFFTFIVQRKDGKSVTALEKLVMFEDEEDSTYFIFEEELKMDNNDIMKLMANYSKVENEIFQLWKESGSGKSAGDFRKIFYKENIVDLKNT